MLEIYFVVYVSIHRHLIRMNLFGLYQFSSSTFNCFYYITLIKLINLDMFKCKNGNQKIDSLFNQFKQHFILLLYKFHKANLIQMNLQDSRLFFFLKMNECYFK